MNNARKKNFFLKTPKNKKRYNETIILYEIILIMKIINHELFVIKTAIWIISNKKKKKI